MNPSSVPQTCMQAWTCVRYGGPEGLQLQSRPMPRLKDDEVLVEVRATTVASADVRIRTLNLPRGLGWLGRPLFGFTRPRQPVLGTDLAGVVVQVGRQVSGFREGDRVLAMPGAKMACHAQYRAVNATKAIAHLPHGMSFEQAVALAFGGTSALYFLRKSQLKANDSLLVLGASGAVGSSMVQLAQQLGAHVTAVTSAPNLELVQSLGAHQVIDYTQPGGFRVQAQTYDVIADTVAASTFRQCLPLLKEHGRYLAIAGGLPDMLARPRGTRRSISGVAPERAEDLQQLLEMAEAGLLTPVIDQVLDWLDLPLGHARSETGRKRGSVVVRLSPANADPSEQAPRLPKPSILIA